MAPPIRVAVIMAGGSGERFWPMSRAQRPKQLLRLTDPNETMLQEAVSRIEPLIPADRIFVATSRTLADVVAKGDSRLPVENILAEPCKRNTAGCLAWAAANLMARHGEDTEITMAILTADHLIGDRENFRRCVDAAMTAAEQHDALVTIGIPPTAPDTAYGYIEAEGEPMELAGFPEIDTRPVRAFREKPDRATAQAYVESGRHYWNSGMFFWRVRTFLDELDAASPALSNLVRQLAGVLRAELAEEAFAAAHAMDEVPPVPDYSGIHDAETLFSQIENRSIDYVLMEKAQHVLLVRSLFAWDDVGSWDALARVRSVDAAGNVSDGDPVLIDTRNSIVLNDAGPEKLAVGVVGLDNVVVVATEDAVLVVAKDRVQDVRHIVAALKERGGRQT